MPNSGRCVWLGTFELCSITGRLREGQGLTVLNAGGVKHKMISDGKISNVGVIVQFNAFS